MCLWLKKNYCILHNLFKYFLAAFCIFRISMKFVIFWFTFWPISKSKTKWSTAGAVSITTAVSISTATYAAVFGQLKFFFRLFSFFAVNFKQIHTGNKKKKFENKMSYWLKRRFKKKNFFLLPFFDLLFCRRRTIFAEF